MLAEAVEVDLIDHLEIARVRVEVVMGCAAAAADAHVVGMQAVMTAFFGLASMPAGLEDAWQLLVGVDRSTELVGLVGLVGLAVEGDEMPPACLAGLECCTLMASVACRQSRWHLGGLG